MALINCSECGNQVSDKATACPKCGAPPQKIFQEQEQIVVQEQKPKEGNSNSHSGTETVYYSDQHGVKITNVRFIVHSATYPLQGITSITTAVVPVSKTSGIIVVIIGIVLLLASKGNVAMAIIGVLIAAAGVFVIMGTKDKHAVKISTSAAETNALVSEDKEHIAQVVRALNEAIIHRG